MRYVRAFLVLLLAVGSCLAADDPFTLDNVTRLAAAAAGGKTQVMVLLLKRDDLKKGDFQRAISYCRDKKLAMAIGGPDAELIHNVLNRELAITGKRNTQGALIVVVGSREEDSRLRPLLESYGVRYFYAKGVADEKKG